MTSDRVGDFIIRLKNAGAIGKQVVSVPAGAHLEAIAHKLKALGFITAIEQSKTPYHFDVTLALDERGRSKIHGVKRVSKPGRRLYAPAAKAHGVKNGLGARILSTPKGILSDREARREHVGGEDLFEIW